MRVILVPVADRPECASALKTAFDLGKRLGASVSGCHMRPHRYSEVSMTTAFADADWRRKSDENAPAAAKAVYEQAAEAAGFELARGPRQKPGALWAEKVGSPSILMGIVGPVNDLIVVSRPDAKGTVADMFMNAALLESSRPVLIVPPNGRRNLGRHVAIGWNQSPEAASAVAAAMPILTRAEQVTIISCGAEDRPGPKSTQLVGYLKHWGVKAERVRTHGDHVESELIGAFREAKADVLVAGAYSRMRWREKIFGGTTEFLLRKARIPVLILHE